MRETAPPELLLLGGSDQVMMALRRRIAGRPALALSRRPAPMAEPGLRWLAADLSRPGALPELGQPLPEAAIATVPLRLLAAALPALAEAGLRRLVGFGSTSLHGKKSSRDPGERELVRRLGEAEALLFAAGERLGLACTVLRPTLVYGLGRDRNVSAIARFIRRFRCFPLPPRATGRRMPVHCDDLAEAALAALAAPQAAGRAYDLGGGEILSYRDMVIRIFQALDRRPILLPVPLLGAAMSLAGRLAGQPWMNPEIVRRMRQDLVYDLGPAMRDLGYRPRRFLRDGPADLGIDQEKALTPR